MVLRDLDAETAASLSGEAGDGPASTTLLERLRRDVPDLTVEQARQVVVAIVWLLTFLSIVKVSLDHFDEAKTLSVAAGASAYTVAKDVANSANSALKRWQKDDE